MPNDNRLNDLDRRVRELEQKLLEAQAERDKAVRMYLQLWQQIHGEKPLEVRL